MPKVSVIIPTYNHAKYVGRAIDSVLVQTYKNYEIIVVDDGSTDNTKAVLKPYMDKIKYIYQENKGLSSARNTGIRASKGEYLQFLDADDELLPQKFEIQVNILETHPEIDVIACEWIRVDENGNILPGEGKCAKSTFSFKDLVLGNPFIVHILLLRRKCFNLAGLFDESLNVYEDWDMWLRIAAKGYRFYCDSQKLVKRYLISSSIRTHSTYKDKTKILEKVFMSPEVDEGIKALNNQAYSHLHLSFCSTHYRLNQIREGRNHFIEAVKLEPLLLTNPETFYQIFVFFKPPGYSGIPESVKDLDNIKKEIFSILNELYHKENFSSEIKQLKKQAYSSAYLAIALRFYELRELSNSRRYFINSFRIYPLLVLKLPHILSYLKPLLGARVVNMIVSGKNKVLEIIK